MDQESLPKVTVKFVTPTEQQEQFGLTFVVGLSTGQNVSLNAKELIDVDLMRTCVLASTGRLVHLGLTNAGWLQMLEYLLEGPPHSA